MRTLVTGGSGFLGRWLRGLLPGPLWAPTRAELDLLDAGSIRRFVADLRPELVFHLGGLTDPGAAERDPALALAVNGEGTRALLSALGRPGVRVVHVSTCHVLGRPTRLPMDEDHPLGPRGSYALSKAAGERAAREVAGARGLALVVARPFNLLGPGQPRAHAVADWILQAGRGVSRIRVGDLSLRRDYLDVRDCARALAQLGPTAPAGSTLHLCSGRALALSTLAALAAPGCAFEVEAARLRRGEAPILLGDNRRARALGWAPAIPIAQSVEDLRRSLSSW